MSDLKRTPLFELHQELGAKMTGFAGFDMPVQYKLGVMGEHKHTRALAGLFDVSHMGQVLVRHSDGYRGAAKAMEQLVPVDLLGLGAHRQRYGFFTNDTGGILDDLMLTNRQDHLYVVVNAACKEADLAHMQAGMPDCEIELLADRALLALQGPASESVLAAFVLEVSSMRFLDTGVFASDFGELWISRSGYTGEDGFEISVDAAKAEGMARALLKNDAVEPIGLGARDSLRLEAGLCLYGQDIDETTSPIEAGLTWAIQKARRGGGDREGGFPGGKRILTELDKGPEKLRVGLRPSGRAPMRTGTALFATKDDEIPVGHVTSGAFGPTIEAPMSMGYVSAACSEPGTDLFGDVRGKRLPVQVSPMPFTPANFKR
ncbi:MAG: glycine cleavage system aminomethyltransferase GcvT [Pseudomonadota bacterium]